MTSVDVIEIYTSLADLGICVWIDGGWGVDALLGRPTRSHKDLDIAIENHHLLLFEQFLASRGYHRTKREIERSFNFVLTDHKGREIDVHVISRDESGNGIYGPPEMGVIYPAESLTGNGVIDDYPVRCISPQWMIKFHSGYTLTEKDYKDVSALCEKYGIQLPHEYLQFTKRR
jgi:lincosamide nucleotidyltransferase A/C/D/E